MLAITILFTLADRSNSSFFVDTLIGVDMAVGVIVAVVVDVFDVFGVLAATIAPPPAVDVTIFGFFLTDLPRFIYGSDID